MMTTQDVTRRNRPALMLVLVALGLMSVAANCGGSKSETKADANAPTTAGGTTGTAGGTTGAAKAPDAPKADGKVPGKDIYPGFNFGLLEDQERVQFVGIAEAEMCPCPDAQVSLHVCLQKTREAGRCELAEMAAQIIAVGIKQKLKQTDILDKLAAQMTAMKSTHTFELSNMTPKGNKDAKIVIVEFADFQCPHCRMAAKLMDEVLKKHKDDVAFYFKTFPLGPGVRLVAAQAAYAAGRQGKFWEMHDLLFANQMKLTEEMITGFAQQLGMNVEKFQADLKNPDVIGLVQRDRSEGEKAKITGTPTMFVNGKLYMGDKSVEGISKMIEEMKAKK